MSSSSTSIRTSNTHQHWEVFPSPSGNKRVCFADGGEGHGDKRMKAQKTKALGEMFPQPTNIEEVIGTLSTGEILVKMTDEEHDAFLSGIGESWKPKKYSPEQIETIISVNREHKTSKKTICDYLESKHGIKISTGTMNKIVRGEY